MRIERNNRAGKGNRKLMNYDEINKELQRTLGKGVVRITPAQRVDGFELHFRDKKPSVKIIEMARTVVVAYTGPVEWGRMRRRR